MSKHVDETAIRAQAERMWVANPGIREEFLNYGQYVAYKLAEAKGQFAVLRRERSSG